MKKETLMQPETLYLLDSFYAIKFKYHMLTEMTLFMALPPTLRRFHWSFIGETEDSAGTYRMDSLLIERNFPIEVALARQSGLNLKDYVLIKKL